VFAIEATDLKDIEHGIQELINGALEELASNGVSNSEESRN
jgi:hypothetical protein